MITAYTASGGIHRTNSCGDPSTCLVVEYIVPVLAGFAAPSTGTYVCVHHAVPCRVCRASTSCQVHQVNASRDGRVRASVRVSHPPLDVVAPGPVVECIDTAPAVSILPVPAAKYLEPPPAVTGTPALVLEFNDAAPAVLIPPTGAVEQIELALAVSVAPASSGRRPQGGACSARARQSRQRPCSSTSMQRLPCQPHQRTRPSSLC